uniref:Si:ch211-156b7.4 n=1 Tax=Haplochromis burtoni TaxID=8153 RepID=A0A3Q2UWV6_HAPBU
MCRSGAVWEMCVNTIFQGVDINVGQLLTLHAPVSILNVNRHVSRKGRAMPSNVEIKAKVSDLTQFAQKAAELSQSEGTIIRQHDTFFSCSQGRLKLRDFMNGSGQLIFYERPDTDGPKLSRYSITPTSDPQSLQVVLSEALGIKGEVKKERRLFLIGQTRVHLDTVEGLGHYMELEVSKPVAEDLMEKLGVSKESLVTGAYMDLLLKEHKEI